MKNILAPGVADRKGTWRECKLDITKCSSAQLNVLQGFTSIIHSDCVCSIDINLSPILFKKKKKILTRFLLNLSGYRLEFLKALNGFGNGNSPSRGMFINSCYSHCQTGIQETWLRNDSPLLGNTVMSFSL